MKISKNQLRQVIQEELAGVLQEQGLVNEINIMGYEPWEGYLPGSADTYLDALTAAGALTGGAVGATGGGVLGAGGAVAGGAPTMGALAAPGAVVGGLGGAAAGGLGGAAAGGYGARQLGRTAMDYLGLGPRANRAPAPSEMPRIYGPNPEGPGYKPPTRGGGPTPTPAPRPAPTPEISPAPEAGPTTPSTQTYGRRGLKQAVRGAAGLERGKGSLDKAQRQAFQQSWRGGQVDPTATAGRELRQIDSGGAQGAADAGRTRGQERRFQKLKGMEDPARRDMYEEIYEAVIRELGK